MASPRPARHRLAGFVLLLALMLAGSGAARGQRIALVLGNGKYEAGNELPNPPRDARAVASMLAGLGFAVTPLLDGRLRDMQQAIARFSSDASRAEIAIVFYAGHGMQIRGTNLLVPVDMPAPPAGTDPAAHTLARAVSLDAVRQAIAGARVQMIFLDACRNNPFIPRTRSFGASQGLAREMSLQPRPGSSTLVAYATAPDQVADDGDGANSPFTTALLQHLPSPSLDIMQVMARVTRDVETSTGGRQRPFVDSSIAADVILRPAAPSPALQPVLALAPPLPPRETRPQTGDARLMAAYALANTRNIPLPAGLALGPQAGPPGLAGAWATTPEADTILVVLSAVGDRAEIVEARRTPDQPRGASERRSVELDGRSFEFARDNGDLVRYDLPSNGQARLTIEAGVARPSQQSRLPVARVRAMELRRLD
ncbi:Caspase family protein [Rhodovastum atsumiense]|uniref:Caspase family protein n=1 Tax=Rhodovastum atsumiense TaxID=504468 RepID=A0A5M6IWS8_9PROT|nr:caspase family protein [Rhodovastum atsumiense]KAA5612691.1 caspase family protein [Rhodovastum atsumiense]CAH2602760.1 Caspase family protein [Rhodovastum atsumiense]